MNDPKALWNPSLTRRHFMIGAAGLSAAFALDSVAAAALLAGERSGKALSPWVSIGTDGTVTILSAATEMGQGSMTSLPLILAEELDADWSRVRVVPAPPQESIYGNPGFAGMMYTAASNAVTSYYKPLRTLGAQVRRVLLDNAAAKWSVPVDELTTEPGVVVHAKSGRRLSYGEIAAFAEVPEKAPEIKPEDLKKPADFRLIGKDTLRLDLPSKINGTARYAIDVQVPGMLYGAVLRAPVEGASAESIDEAKVKAIRGVVHVAMLAYGVGVVAQTPWAAFAGREAVARTVRWKREGRAWGFDSDKGLEDFIAAVRDPNRQASDWFKEGDARAELSKAAGTFEGEYRCDYAYHAQMEPLNALASVPASGDSAEVWCGTQSQTMAHAAIAKALGIGREKVVLHDMLMGGGFGRRGPRDEDFVVDAVLLSKAVARPVKVMWTREDDLHNGRFRPLSAHKLRAGFDSTGRLVAYDHRIAGDRVTPFADPIRYEKAGRKDFILMLGSNLKGYDIPHQLVEQIYEDTGVRTAPLRGIGFTANKFAAEVFIDEIALWKGIDPLTYRRTLLQGNARALKVLDRAAQMAEWGRKREGRGLGVAFIDYSGSQLAGIAEVSIDGDTGEIALHDFWCTIDCGVAVQPDNVVAQTQSSIIYGVGLALHERVSFKDGAVEQSNFYNYLVPRMHDIPNMHIDVLSTDNHPTGAGQMATPLLAPAISNAVANLTGKRMRHTPFTPERVRQALA